MIRIASRTSLWGGALGRCTRGVLPPFAQVTATGKVPKAEASADRGTSTLHVETTVAVTMSGADADCAEASAGAPARMAAVKTLRTIPFHSRLANLEPLRRAIPSLISDTNSRI
jgi:hypothetical protein